MILLRPELKFMSVGSTLGITLALFITLFIPINWIKILTAFYMGLSIVGIYNLKDEIKELF